LPLLVLLLLLGANALPGEELVLQRVELQDGRTLLGRYDQAKGMLSLCDEKTGKVLGTVPVKAEEVKTVVEVRMVAKEADPLDKRGLNGKWIVNHEAAVKLAGEAHRPILVVLTGSDWCPWCVKLEREIFANQKFKDWAKENVVLLYLDFPQTRKLSKEQEKQNRDLQAKWGAEGYPTLFLLSEKGEKYDWKYGYNDGGIDNWLAYLDASKKRLVK
jgi:protein disulfide-isomerase